MRATITTMRALVLTVSLVAGDAAVGLSAPQPTPEMTGTWVLNTELSDKPSMPTGNDDGGERGRGRPGGPGGSMGGFGGGGMGGRGGGMGGGRGEGGMPSREDMERQRGSS